MDLVVRMPFIPRPGETVLGGVFTTYPGGKGSNQAVAAARLGGQVTIIGRVGVDEFGEKLIQMAREEGIDTRFVGVDLESATGVALITTDAQGQNSIAVASGANFTLTAKAVKNAFDQLSEVDLVVMQLETPMDTIITTAELAKQRGAQVLLNPAPASHLSPNLLRLVDVLIPNEIETAFLIGAEVRELHDPYKAATDLLGLGPQSVILTLGNQGALVAEKVTNRIALALIPAYPVKAVDTTSAGDAFIGALAVALGEGRTLVEAAHFANAAAAISVTRLGAQPSLPHRAEVDKFLIDRS